MAFLLAEMHKLHGKLTKAISTNDPRAQHDCLRELGKLTDYLADWLQRNA